MKSAKTGFIRLLIQRISGQFILYPFFVVVLAFHQISAQSYNFQWVLEAGNISSDQGIAVSADDAGNNWAIGKYYGEPVFGDTAKTCGEDMNFFLVMHDKYGNLEWVRYMKVSYVFDLDVNASGDCMITGTFGNSAMFCDTTLLSDGYRNIFVAKYDMIGNLVWAMKAGGPDLEANSIALSNDGDFWLTGAFGDSVGLGGKPLISSGSDDIFVAKYSDEGDILWANRAGGQYPDAGRSITHDMAGNALVTGYYKDVSDFGDTTITAPNNEDVFTAKYNPEGGVMWVRSPAGPYVDWPWGIAVTPAGDCFVTGSFEDSLTLGNIVLHAPAASGDIFVASYRSDGELRWAERAGGEGWDEALAVSAEENGSCTVTGLFSAPADFGDTTLTNESGTWDIFIAEYDSSGKVDWVKQIVGQGTDWGQGIASDNTGGRYVAGFFEGPCTFDEKILTGFGNKDIFIAKLSDEPVGLNSAQYQWPQMYYISQNYPNPFNPSTTITFKIPQSEHVTLNVYNTLGQKVTTLLDRKMNTGLHEVQFDASTLPSGIYFYRIQVGDAPGRNGGFSQVRKMVLLR